MNNMCRSVILCAALVSVGASPGQRPEVASVMRAKLEHAQKAFEAVVTSDWKALETESRQLEQLTSDRRWMVFNYPEYAQQSAAFVKSVQALHDAAVQRDLEKTPTAYTEMALQCVACHRYLARARLAR